MIYGSYVESLNALFWGGGEKYELKNVFILPELKVSEKVKFSTQNDFFQIKK